MFSWLTNPNALLAGVVLTLVQLLAALPWLRAIDTAAFDRAVRRPGTWTTALVAFLAASLAAAGFVSYRGDSAGLVSLGKLYGGVLHLQILLDLFLVVPSVLILFAPKIGAVALAAYRESWRQSLFLLIAVGAIVAMWISVVVPYFTFGDDFKMMKQIGFDIITLAAVLFGVLAASLSVSEEIEGRTALTVMSKPVNRRQFLIGKFLGILMACGALSLLLGLNFNGTLLAMPEFDPINKDVAKDQLALDAQEWAVPRFQKLLPPGPGSLVAQGAGLWFGDTYANSLGILLGFGQVMVLVALATALATRLPFVVNLVLCLVIRFFGHLAPVVVRATESRRGDQSTASGLVQFLSNLFDTILPALEFFNMGPAIIRDAPLGLAAFTGYVAAVTGYAVLYSVIAMLLGLILFENRDLA